MNILYILNSGKMGGMERHVYDLITGMAGDGQKVFVWCADGEMPVKYTDAGAEVYREQIRCEVDFFYIIKLVKFLKSKKIDIIHAHEPKAVSHALVAGALAGTKVRISHTHTPISTWKINKLKRFLDVKINTLLVNTFSTKEIALTDSVFRTKQKEGIKSDKLCVIPNALNVGYLTVSDTDRGAYRDEIRSKYSIGKNDIVFGCVGRLTEEKGHEVLIRAFKHFMDNETSGKENFYLLIAGTGPLDEKLKSLTRTLSVDKNVVFTGAFSDEDKVKIYLAMDVFVFPSYTEGFGIVLIEAMYLNLPVIASDIEVLREVGKNKITYFKPGDPADLGEKMRALYKEITSEGNSGIEKFFAKVETEYTMSGFINSYLNLYKDLL